MNDEQEEKILEERKKKILSFVNEKKNWITYILLTIIVYIGIYVRTLNISRLKDVTTGSWTLGPDLDPFLFLRWAEYIVEHGKLMTIDMMRYVPIGFNTAGELRLLPYSIAWFHQLLSGLGFSESVTYSAIIFPVFMFALTIIAFFLFSRKIFYKEKNWVKDSIALISTLLFALTPSLLPRTIAGIPEKESAAFFFIFLAFYLFLESLTSNTNKRSYIFGMLAGIITGMLALIWGGYNYVFLTIPPAILVSFLINKIGKKEYISYLIWILFSFLLMIPFSTRYTPSSLVTSTSTSISLFVAAIIGISFFIDKNDKISRLRNKIKLPRLISNLVISIIIVCVFVLVILGPGEITHLLKDVVNSLVNPQTSRFGLTVAENRQPFFQNDWKESFGPSISGIPVYFWLFLIGSIALFYYLVRNLGKKEKMFVVGGYTLFLIALIFSKFSESSILNGETFISLFIYFAGAVVFVVSVGYVYYNYYKKGEFDKFREFNISYILYFMILILTILAARAAIRLIMVLAAVVPIVVAFLFIKFIEKSKEEKSENKKMWWGVISVVIALLLIFTSYNYFMNDKIIGSNYAPASYQQQWQGAMSWVRENTPENAVFAHWWDYGYWIQSIGGRATILDGGNAIVYWNYLMGRHVLTGTEEQKALEFLYTHNGTHLLIDSTDIGKYTAFSSIGSDEDYDRFSWITNFLLDESQTRTSGNITQMVYSGGWILDEDIIWEEKGREILLPARSAGLGAIIIQENDTGYEQPTGIFIYNNKQYNIPLRYIYQGDEKIDFESGIEAGIFLYPRIIPSGSGEVEINEKGAGMFFSERTVNSLLAQLYVFDQESEYFKLVHREDNQIIKSLRSQGLNINEFVYYQGFQGPIKIWEISYPNNINYNESYLKLNFPNPELNLAKSGVY